MTVLIKYKSYLTNALQLQVITEIRMKGQPDWAWSELSIRITVWSLELQAGEMQPAGVLDISVLGSNEHSIYTVAAL